MTDRLRANELARTTTRSIHIQTLLTAERMQGPGFAFALLPVLRRLYPDREARGRALVRHLGYFATHPVLAGYVLGATARLEERRAAGEEPVPEERIETLKQSLASPLAALGDPLFWVTLRPLAGLLGVLAVAFLPGDEATGPDLRVLLCPLFTLLAYNAFALPLRLPSVARGYAEADRPGALLRSLRLPELRQVLARAGALGYGALVALVARSLDLGSAGWGTGAGDRLSSLAPLLVGAVVGYAGLRRWPGAGVEVALAALGVGLALAAGR